MSCAIVKIPSCIFNPIISNVLWRPKQITICNFANVGKNSIFHYFLPVTSVGPGLKSVSYIKRQFNSFGGGWTKHNVQSCKMLGKIFVVFILVFSLAGCATKPAEWYSQYGIPDRAALTKTESIPKLIKALDDDLPEIRANASEVLGTFGPVAKNAADKLHNLRKNDTNGTVRLFAHYALKEIFAGDYDG